MQTTRGHPGIEDYEELERRLMAQQQETTGNKSHNETPEERPVLGDIVERRKPGKKAPQVTTSSTTTSGTDSVDSLQAGIDGENKRIISGMSQDEIESEVAALKATLPPKLIEKWSLKKSQ